MNRKVLKLLATTLTTAALAMSSAHASISEWPNDIVPFDAAAEEPAVAAFEENFPSSDAPDVALLLDLPVDYFGELSFPPMPDFGVDEPPLMIAGLDPLQTP
jgi:hypothetical protein